MLEYTEYRRILRECENLSRKKNAAYGSKGLSVFGGKGCLIRIADKVFRIVNSAEKNLKDEENVEDNLKDIVNYAVYYIMIKRGKLVKPEVQ